MYPCWPMTPESSPPFHQIWLPASPAPLRKLHAVRFSMLTLSAFHTTMPLRPSALPFEPTAPKLCSAGAGAARGRRARLGAVHDDGAPVHPPQVDVRLRDEDAAEVTVVGVGRRVGLVVGLVVVARCHEDPVAGPGRVDGGLDGPVRAGVPVECADQQHVARWPNPSPSPVPSCTPPGSLPAGTPPRSAAPSPRVATDRAS